MRRFTDILIVGLVLNFAGFVLGADVILNEYNAVDADTYLGGGTEALDDNGTRASDTYFGRVLGNGGDWFELVVITDHLDMRNWKLDIYTSGLWDKTLTLTNHSIWSDLRSGTIITVSEDLPSNIGYNPAGGDWWINVQANSTADGLYIEASSFPVNSSNWQLRIRNAAGTVIFGPAGEGVSPASGIGGTEIFRLEAAPDASTLPASVDYDSGDSLSTFGQPNQWGIQNLFALRSAAAQAATLTLLTPNGSEVIAAGSEYNITWNFTGNPGGVQIDLSVNNGIAWTAVYPPNVGNTGSYIWRVPAIKSQQCRIRIRDTANSAIYDTSDASFRIYECTVDGDVTGDCIVNMDDLAIMASFWLDCGSPNCP